jgi:N-acetyl-anhydromuramyl-L-alanine amidase AmpD
MRPIKKIIIHCAATHEGDDVSIETIRGWHKERGFKDIGYHFLILIDGTIERGRAIEKQGAHCKNNNFDSIGICYVGGLDKKGKIKDTRTDAQKESLQWLVKTLRQTYASIKEVKGHRDYSPDLNGDGKITSNEWLKGCPCFDVEKEF